MLPRQDSYQFLKERLDNFDSDGQTGCALETRLEEQNRVLEQLQSQNEGILQQREQERGRVAEYNALISAQQEGLKEQQTVIDTLQQHSSRERTKIQETSQSEVKRLGQQKRLLEEELERVREEKSRLLARLSESDSSHERQVDNMRRQIEEYQGKQRVLETWLHREEQQNRTH